MKLLYLHDPLCGWCYGFIPALDAFTAAHPEIEIEVIPGGLVRGNKVGPYSDMLHYITNAAPRMTQVTGQALREPFFDMMRQAETPLSISAPPSHAILQMKAQTNWGNVLRFAHALQTRHFRDGWDLNLASTYDTVCHELDLPHVDTDAISAATEDDPRVAASYDRAATLGVSSFPTCILVDEGGVVLGTVASIYDPQDFEAAIMRLIN